MEYDMNDRKIHSVRYNFVMNFLLTASQFLFPLITALNISSIVCLTILELILSLLDNEYKDV